MQLSEVCFSVASGNVDGRHGVHGSVLAELARKTQYVAISCWRKRQGFKIIAQMDLPRSVGQGHQQHRLASYTPGKLPPSIIGEFTRWLVVLSPSTSI